MNNRHFIILSFLAFCSCSPFATLTTPTSSLIEMNLTSSAKVIAFMHSHRLEVQVLGLIMVEREMYKDYWKVRQKNTPNFYVVDFAGKYRLFNPNEKHYNLGALFIANGYRYEVIKNDSLIEVIQRGKLHN